MVTRNKLSTNIRTAAQTTDDLMEELDRALSNPNEIFGFGRYGDGKRWLVLDKMTGGLQPNTLTVLAARPKVGKSMLAAGWVPIIAQQALAEDRVVRIVSLEMSRVSYQRRMAAIAAGIRDPMRIRQGLLDVGEVKRYRAALTQIGNLPIEYLANETDLTEEETFTEGSSPITVRDVDRFIRGGDTGQETYWWLLDHIGLLNDLNASGEMTVSIYHLANKLAYIAHKVAAGMVITHLTRASAGGMPTIESIAGSDQIGRDADLIFLLYRPFMGVELSEEDAQLIEQGEPAYLVVYSRDEVGGVDILWWSKEQASYAEMRVPPGTQIPTPKKKGKPGSR